MFGRPFMPGLQAAQAGLIPGQIQEDVFGALQDPRAIAALMGTPMAPGGGIGGDLPQVRGMQNDPRGLMSQRGGIGGPAMPMGDMGPPRPKGDAPGMFAAAGPLNGSGSIRNALANNALETPAKPFKGMFPGKDINYILKNIVPAAITGWMAGGGNPMGMAMLQHRNRMQEAQAEADIRMRMPQQVGNSVMRYNPQTDSYDTLGRDLNDAEQYAANLNLQPGTPEWQVAVQEYRAPAWSPTALEGKQTMEGVRWTYRGNDREDKQEHQWGLQDDRQEHSDAQLGRRLTQSDTNNRRSTGVSRDNSIRSNETQRGSYYYQNGGRGGGKGGAKPLGSGNTEFPKSSPTDKLVGDPVEKDGVRIQYSATRKAYVRVK